MTGYIPLPPPPWVPIAVDSETNLPPDPVVSAIRAGLATTSAVAAAQGAADDAQTAADDAREVADAAVPNTPEGRQALAESTELLDTTARMVRPLDAIMRRLDMRQIPGAVIACAGDSTTSPFATGAFEVAWQELAAALWPDRPFRLFRWGKESNQYPASPTIWQDAAVISDPGGTEDDVLILADSFAETGVEAVGRVPEVGVGAWTGTSGAYLAQGGSILANPAYSGGGIPALQATSIAREGKDFVYSGQWRIEMLGSSVQRRVRAAISGNNEIRLQVAGGSTPTVTAAKIIGGTSTSLGSFPGTPIPSSTAEAWYDFEIALDGTTVTVTLNGQTVTATLTSGDVAALGSLFGIADQSSKAGIRALEVRGSVTTPPVAGGPSPLDWATVYNASVAGSTIAYQQARIAAMYPVQPDVLFIHHGHNYADDGITAAAFLAAIDGFVAALFSVWQPCPVVLSSQNPEFVTATQTDAARVADHLEFMGAARDHARTRGWGYVPILEAFAARPDGGVSYVQSDGIHPVIGAGTNLQRDVLKAWITAQSERPSAS